MLPTVFPSAALLLLLDDLLTGQLAAATLSLFVNNIDPQENAVLGDFTLAAFTGSAPKTITAWGESYVNPQGDAEAVGTLLQWNWTALGPETVYGVVLRSAGTGTPFLSYARLSTPKVMDDAADSLIIVPKITLGPRGFGAMLHVNEAA